MKHTKYVTPEKAYKKMTSDGKSVTAKEAESFFLHTARMLKSLVCECLIEWALTRKIKVRSPLVSR